MNELHQHRTAALLFPIFNSMTLSDVGGDVWPAFCP
jgi:hypothetical protein